MMKATKMNQNRQPEILQIRERLRNLNISIQPPKTFKKEGCIVNLTGYKSIQDSFVVDVDEEINKKDSKVECKEKRCDLILWTNKKCVLIEAKNGPARDKAKEQLVNTRKWLKKHISQEITYHLLLIAESIPPYLLRSRKFQKAQIRHKKCGEYLNI